MTIKTYPITAAVLFLAALGFLVSGIILNFDTAILTCFVVLSILTLWHIYEYIQVRNDQIMIGQDGVYISEYEYEKIIPWKKIEKVEFGMEAGSGMFLKFYVDKGVEKIEFGNSTLYVASFYKMNKTIKNYYRKEVLVTSYLWYMKLF